MIETIGLIALLGLLIAFDLTTLAARSALQGSSYARLLGYREQFGKRANRAIFLFQHYARLQASLNLALVLARFALAGWCLLVLQGLYPALSWWQALIALLLAGLILFLGEHLMAGEAPRAAELNLVRLSSYARVLMAVAAPLVALPLALSKDLTRNEEPPASVTEDELMTLVDASQEEGMIEQGERQMIYSVFALSHSLAREIMVPRIDMLALEVNTPLTTAIEVFINTGHSRVPVYEDTVDNMLGLLYAKDLLRVWRAGQQLESLHSLLRPAYYIPEAKKLDELLAEMQSQRIHLAMVVDEYGGIAGLVALEDIVEEILGEIRDEYDQAEELPYQALKNGDYIFQGRIDLGDFNEIMGSSLSKDEADTLGGYIYSQLGHVPEVGEVVQGDRLRLIVEQVSSRRIRKVRARWSQPEEESREENKDAIG